METRRFGSTGMELSVVGLGGLLAHYAGVQGHPSPEEKTRIYRRAVEAGINLFDTGYGDEVHIPEELKGPGGDRHFSFKAAGGRTERLEQVIDDLLRLLRREAVDILRLHHMDYVDQPALAPEVERLKQAGKVRSVCLIRHFRASQEAYVERGPEPGTDADLVIYNYACRWQAPGIEASARRGTGVLVMKALGGQYISWEDMVRTDWSRATHDTALEMCPLEGAEEEVEDLIFPMVAGPWHELARPGERMPRPRAAVEWVLGNRQVHSALVAVASVDELEEAVDAAVGVPP